MKNYFLLPLEKSKRELEIENILEALTSKGWRLHTWLSKNKDWWLLILEKN